MKILFTKSNSIGSKFIRWGLNEPVSHTAIKFSDGTIIHSDYDGIRITHIDLLLRNNEIVYSITLDKSLDWELKKKQEIIDRYKHKGYDYVGFLWLTYRGILKKLFGLPIPHHNPLNQRNRFLCTELVSSVLFNKELGYISPYQLYLKLKGE